MLIFSFFFFFSPQLLLKCISRFGSTCITSTHTNTHTHTHTHIRARQNTHLLTFPVHHFCCCYAQSSLSTHSWIIQSCTKKKKKNPASSLAVSLSHTLTSSLLAALLFSLPLFPLSVSHTHRRAYIHSPSHTHMQFSLSRPPSPTYCLDRERSFYQQGYFTLRLWLIRGGVEVEDEAVEEEEEEEEAGGMRWER